MNNNFSTILITFILLAVSILTGCTKEPQSKLEESTHMHEHGSMQKEEKVVATKNQTTCPVMGGEIDKSVYADHEGKRVYFCCASCLAEFNKIPEKYVKKLEDEGVILEKVPTD